MSESPLPPSPLALSGNLAAEGCIGSPPSPLGRGDGGEGRDRPVPGRQSRPGGSGGLSRAAGEGESDKRYFDRLRWRCRRGVLELDVLLQDFLAARYADLSASERGAFERLLDTPDATLLDYLHGGENPVDPELISIVGKIRQ